MKKSKIVYVAAFALLLAQTAFGQSDGQSTYTHVIELEKVMTMPAGTKSATYFFRAPVNAKYYIQGAETEKSGARFLLYNDKKKEIAEKRSVLEKELKAGNYHLEVATGGTKDFPFIVTLHTPHSAATPYKVKEAQTQFAKASEAQVSKNISFEVTRDKRETFYRFMVSDAARYHFSAKAGGDNSAIALYTDNFRPISEYSSGDAMFELIPGTYHLKVGASNTMPGTYQLYIAKEGEQEYNYVAPSWREKFEKENRALYMLFLVLLGITIPAILYLAAFRPYVRYLKEKFDIRFFNVPFFIMLIVLTGIVFRENYKNITPGFLEYTVLIVTDILCALWLCLKNYRKTKKPLLVVADLILVHIAWALAFTFLFFAFFLALIVIVLAVIGAIIMLVGSAVGSIGFGGSDAGGGGGHEMCPSCGARKRAGKHACPSCGYH